MNIIGVHLGHNASACLMLDGKATIAIQEERFTKIKNFCGYPQQSIDYCFNYLKEHKLELDKVAFSTENNVAFWLAYPLQHYFKMQDYHDHYGAAFYGRKLAGENVNDYYEKLIGWSKNNNAPVYLPYEQIGDTDALLNGPEKFRDFQRMTISKQCNIDPNNVEFVDHHTSHAAYGYYASNRKNDDCVVVTLDSDGDGRNQTAWQFSKDGGKLLRSSNQSDLARIYKLTTLILGMKPDEHEFKVMGMAPYAKSNYVDLVYQDVYEPLLKVEDGRIVHKDRPLDMYTYLKEKLMPYRFDNIAGAVQKLVEVISLELFTQLHELTGVRHFCVSGGVSMNIKMNMLLSQLDFIDGIYVPASGSDESLCMGACFHIEKSNSQPLVNTYLGHDITDDLTDENIKTLFSDNGYKVEKGIGHSHLANILAEGNVVAVVRGREEFGARALGNRSIIANPNDHETVKVINEAIKNRDFWMPFALTMMEDHTTDYLVNPKSLNSPFMTIGFETLDNENYHNIKAGTHPYDRTCRPQILSKKANPEYYNLINEFHKVTGVPALMNTSLNLHGSPICSTLTDVHYTFENSGLKYLYINDDYLISKIS